MRVVTARMASAPVRSPNPTSMSAPGQSDRPRLTTDPATIQATIGIRAQTNTRTDSPHNRYHIDPRELVRIQREGRERGEDIIGFYHSHPDHPARWSQTDLAEAHWFGCSYVITSVEKGKAAVTNSFELAGADEADKQLIDEKITVA